MAAITGAVIAAGSAVGSIASQKSAAKSARRSQKRAADASIAEQQRQFDQTREDFSGFRERGEAAGSELNAFLGLSGAEAEADALGRFNESPGQAFLRERQERALTRNAAATGGLQGGNVQTALQEQAFGIASQQLGERKDRLAGVAQLGAGVTTSGAQIGSNISRGISDTTLSAGDAEAQNILNADAARQSGLSRVAGAFTGSGGILEQFQPTAVIPPARAQVGAPI